MSELHLDIESRSERDIKVGVYVYSECPTTRINCVSWALNDEPIATWYFWQPIPQRLLDLMNDPAVQLMAHNASFERVMFNGGPGQRAGFPATPISRWTCTAALAASMGLPRSLDGACAALGLAIQKDAEGKKVMLRTCKPVPPKVRAKRKAEDKHVWTTITRPALKREALRLPKVWVEDDATWLRLGQYCEVDVEAERAIAKKLPAMWPPERDLWILTEEMNDTGVLVDQRLLMAVLFLVEDAEQVLNDKLRAITGYDEKTGMGVGAVCDHGAITRWLRSFEVEDDVEKFGEEGVAKHALAKLLERTDLPADVRNVLLMRQEGGKSSAAKYLKMLERMSLDGTIKGCLLFCGAPASSRWSGVGIQPQNLPNVRTIKKPLEAIGDLLDGATLAEIEAKHGPALVVASELLRPTLIAHNGEVLGRGDSSQIEARTLPWSAGAGWKIQGFRDYDAGTGPDLYCLMAAIILGVSIEEVNENHKNGDGMMRQGSGKTPELACFAPNTQVLTNSGLVAISMIKSHHKLWDGVQWTNHAGVVSKGRKAMVLVDGIRVTADHSILTGATWRPASQLASNRGLTCRALATGSASLPLLNFNLDPGFSCSATAAPRPIKSTFTICAQVGQPVATLVQNDRVARARRLSDFSFMHPTCPMSSTGADSSIDSMRPCNDATTPSRRDITVTEGEESLWTPPGEPTKAPFCDTFRRVPAGTMPVSRWTEPTTAEAMSQETFGSSPNESTELTSEQFKKCSSESTTWNDAFDIMNAGPLNRFTIKTDSGWLIVHNCGYGGGEGAFMSWAKIFKLNWITAEWANATKDMWRAKNPEIVALWRECGEAAFACMRGKPDGTLYPFGKQGGGFRRNREALVMRLPSGHALYHWNPRIGPWRTSWGEMRTSIIYRHIHPKTKQWVETGAYDGKWVAIYNQATARDLMGHWLLKGRSVGLLPCLTVHDEGVFRASLARFGDVETVKRLIKSTVMSDLPAWANSLPVNSDSTAGPRYLKQS